jgi:hypothetical protein
MIAYTPFLQPLNVHDVWWFMLIPMALFMSMAYKGVRLRELSARWYWRSVLVMTAQVVLALVALAVGMWIAVEHVVPWFQR